MFEGISWLGFQLLVFVAALAAAEGLLLLVFGTSRSRSRAAVARLRRFAARLQDIENPDADSIVRKEGERGALAQFMARAARRASLELLLYRAGLAWSALRFAGLSAALGLGAGFAGTALMTRPIGLALGALAALVPLGYVLFSARARMRRFEEQLPDALDLICRALRSGISLEFGFKSVGEELRDPISTEFGQLAHEISLGLPVRTALEHLGERVVCKDLPFLSTAVLIQRETGGNLAEVLENLSRVVRERLQFQLKVRAIMAQMKMTADLLAVLPFVFAGLITVASPGYLQPLFDTELGRHALHASLAMISIGWILCRRMGTVRM